MADPISMLAIAGLVYAGRTLSTNSKTEKYSPEAKVVLANDGAGPAIPPPFKENNFVSRVEVPAKKEMENFADISRQQRSSGQEVLDMRGRMFDHGRMNNLSPVEKQLVGPGLGVDSNVPAVGGYQQMFRVNPINVGEYRLTTLPGRSGPAADITGGRSAKVGQLTHNKPETTTYLPTRLPTMAGRAQGMTGVVPRNEHERTKRTTNRSETGTRNDGLGYNGAKRLVSAQTLAQDPTRFKADRNDEQYKYNNQPAPGIHSFHGAYTSGVASQVTAKTNEELMKYGFRPEDRRGKPNRMGNAGRMNVRESALKQGGALTAVRSDTTRLDGRVNAANGGWTQQYQSKTFHQLNPYKGNENPNSRRLDIASKQLQNNPLSHALYR
jgi:hypothetical protein|tara:strand:- start:804 stop:1949 length:1146 start_codon:yes stop_codon:yes gene_type:complete